MQKAYVILHRPEGIATNFVLYIAMADTKETALEAVRKLVSPNNGLEINGLPLSAETAKALGLRPGEVRRL